MGILFGYSPYLLPCHSLGQLVKTGFDIHANRLLFSGKNKKNISKCHLLKFLPKVLSVNDAYLIFLSSLWFIKGYVVITHQGNN